MPHIYSLPTVTKLNSHTRIFDMQIFRTHVTELLYFLQRDPPVNLGVSACIRPLIIE